jgi:hypothetical protein
MGYFDKIAEAAFKETEQGMAVYYPNGAMGKGRLISSKEEKEKIFKFHKRLYKVLMFVGLPYGWLLGLSGIFTVSTIAPIIVLAGLMFLRQYWLIRKLPKHELKLGFNEAIGKGSKALPNWYYWVFGLLSVIGIIFALTLPYQLGKTYVELIELVIGFGSFSLLGLGLSIKMYLAKNT